MHPSALNRALGLNTRGGEMPCTIKDFTGHMCRIGKTLPGKNPREFRHPQ